ncbi:hypothetical protein [Actinosynnema sp.]|uniref:hypothetical protein n=1 Tax=Actinosynnema sp. TaxID=1872144 RepID=UPI003F861B34
MESRGALGRFAAPAVAVVAGVLAGVSLFPMWHREYRMNPFGGGIRVESVVGAFARRSTLVGAEVSEPHAPLGWPVALGAALLVVGAVLLALARSRAVGRFLGGLGAGVLLGVLGVVGLAALARTRVLADAEERAGALLGEKAAAGAGVELGLGFWLLCAAALAAVAAVVLARPLGGAGARGRDGLVGGWVLLGAALLVLGGLTPVLYRHALVGGSGAVLEEYLVRGVATEYRGGGFAPGLSGVAVAEQVRLDYAGYPVLIVAGLLLTAWLLLLGGRRSGRVVALVGAGALLASVWSVALQLPALFGRVLTGVEEPAEPVSGFGPGLWLLGAAVVVAFGGAVVAHRWGGRPVPVVEEEAVAP